MSGLSFTPSDAACPIVALTAETLAIWRASASGNAPQWVDANGFEAKPGQSCLLPDDSGQLSQVLVGIEAQPGRYALAELASKLPKGLYTLSGDWSVADHERFALGWALACYRFDRYKTVGAAEAELIVHPSCNAERVRAAVAAHFKVRDLINTPAEDMGPEHLSQALHEVGARFNANVSATVGDDLLENNFRAIHAVGRASHRSPQLIDLQWGEDSHPRLTLVGKGVCFDTGGLDLKPAAGMRLMKKDMGGAAHAIGLAHMIMAAKLPVRLRVLVSAVENSVSGPAYRPGDIIRARNDVTIEIDNTDAEGRVVLSDALVLAGEENPELIIDFATLTGAARVALGTDLPAMFCTRDSTAHGIESAGHRANDPVWRLPLHRPYRELIDSPIADIVNSAGSPFGGAIVAALFLQEFVPEGCDWVHFDLMAWNNRAQPGRPIGGEAMSMHALFDYLLERFG